jgi:DNA-binding IclR family transcriptional regulator
LELGDKAGAMIDIRTEAMPTLKELARKTNETCHLGILDGAEGVYIAKVDSNQLARMNTWEGKRLPMHSTALGKILLAWLPMKDLDEIISHLVFTPYTPNTIASPDVFRTHLKKVAKKGWALDDQENVLHFRCVGVPVRDDKNKVIAAISVTGLASNLEGAHLAEIIEEALNAARQLSEKIGGR